MKTFKTSCACVCKLVAGILLLTGISCQKDTSESIVPSAKESVSARRNVVKDAYLDFVAVADPDYYDVVRYPTYSNMTLGQYTKRARRDAFTSSINISRYSDVVIGNINNYRAGLTAIQRDQFDVYIADLNTTSGYVKTVQFNGVQAVVFRGGSTFDPKPGEYKLASPGIVRGYNQGTTATPARGLSMETKYALSYIQGNGYKITYLPAGLVIALAGNRAPEGHSEIMPLDDMDENLFLTKLSQIQVDPAQ